jgi:hypothetical protein
MRQTFCVDLPNNTIFEPEVARLMRERSGFFFLRNRRSPWMSFESWQKAVREWNPLGKEYLNADTRSAAEDMAYIVFELWRFPLDWQLYYRSCSFGSRRRKWAKDGPVNYPSRAL